MQLRRGIWFWGTETREVVRGEGGRDRGRSPSFCPEKLCGRAGFVVGRAIVWLRVTVASRAMEAGPCVDRFNTPKKNLRTGKLHAPGFQALLSSYRGAAGKPGCQICSQALIETDEVKLEPLDRFLFLLMSAETELNSGGCTSHATASHADFGLSRQAGSSPLKTIRASRSRVSTSRKARSTRPFFRSTNPWKTYRGRPQQSHEYD